MINSPEQSCSNCILLGPWDDQCAVRFITGVCDSYQSAKEQELQTQELEGAFMCDDANNHEDRNCHDCKFSGMAACLETQSHKSTSTPADT